MSRSVEMELNLHLAFACVFALTLASQADKVYRPDYVYNKKTDAFYKLHIDPLWYFYAQERCQLEGAQLMVPASREDIIQTHGMLKRYPDIGDLVLVGSDGQTHESAEETPMVTLEPEEEPPSYPRSCDVVTRTGEIDSIPCHWRKPFICKVEARDTQYDEQCHVYAKGYHYYPAIGSCYKVPNVALRWNEALATCKADGAHLIILNSQQEADTIAGFLKTVPKVPETTRIQYFLAGIRALKLIPGKDREFRTVLNQTLEQTGFTNCWDYQEPNNLNMNEDCGSIWDKSGKYNDIDCIYKYGFICEKEIQIHLGHK